MTVGEKLIKKEKEKGGFFCFDSEWLK